MTRPAPTMPLSTWTCPRCGHRIESRAVTLLPHIRAHFYWAHGRKA